VHHSSVGAGPRSRPGASTTTRVLGIDDFPFRKGQVVGSILTDGESREGLARRVAELHPASPRTPALDRRLVNISYHHKQARHALPTKDPEVERTMRGIRRAKGMAPNGKAPLLPAQLLQAIVALPDTLLGKRDHALLVMALRADA
jgi:hypothetical protein